ncbi:MAG: type II toxin-antitoxin system VapC family toxin [Candidatus Altiarchaeota archaeon]|nr:type II toxin-antitoxin system VapC family toxin [Candidatus Altiarchaeota archaeon]
MPKAAYFDVTSILELLKGGRNILSVVETFQDFYTGANIAATLIGGEDHMVARKTKKKGKMRGLLDSLKVLPITRSDAEKAGEIIGKMKSSGRDVSLDDAIIVAQCSRKGLTLVTHRKNFKNFKTHVDLEIHEV